MSEAKVFIGSPAEANNLAVALQALLERVASARPWSQRIFEPNRGSLESVLAAVNQYDFACFLAPPLDKVSSRGQESPATRDNILLEYGLFLGKLGPGRVFLIRPRDTDLTLPTDLDGVGYLDYRPIDKDNPPVSVLAPAAQVVEEHIKDLGPRYATRRYSGPIVERGTVDRVAGLSDAALYFTEKRYGYKADIRQLILSEEVIPSLYYYATEEGADFWMEMSSDSRYRFKNNSIQVIRRGSKRIADAVLEHIPGGGALDFVSLGSGDGEKDAVLLEKLGGANSASITYYPIDISDTLIVECVRKIHGQALDYVGGKTKAIIADFLDLPHLRSVYEYRSTPNLFSVLGNTFGNTDEAKIMKALQDSMYPGDFVLIEINRDVEEVEAAESFLRDKLTLRYSCVPIDMLGIEVDLTKAFVREEDQLSVFQCAKSTTTYYSELKLEGRSLKDVRLAEDHRYPLDEFAKELAEYLDVEVLLAERYGKAGIVLARRRSEGVDGAS